MNPPRPPLRLVISGYYGRGNIGDEAILAGLVAAFRSREPDVRLTVISARPADTRAHHGVEAVSHRDLLGIGRAIRAADALLSGGGSLLHDQTSQRPVPYYGGTILLARLLGRPAYVHAQGLGPLRRRHQRWLAALALRAATGVSLRDERSVALLHELGVRRTAQIVPDPALALLPPALPEPNGRPRLVVSLRDWPEADRWLPAVTDALRRLGERFEIVLLPMHLPEDIALAEQVAAELDDARVKVPADHRDAIETIAGADVVLGMRLHALILAALAARPFVAVSYDPKVIAFAGQLDQPVGADVHGSVDVDRLVAMVEDHGARDDYRERVATLCARAEASTVELLDRIGATPQ